MSTPPSLSLRRDDLSDADGEWPEKLLTALTNFGRQTQDAFDHNVSLTANLNATVKTLQIAMKDDWVTPTLLGTWVPYQSPPTTYCAPQYRKRNGLVELRGMAKDGVVPSDVYPLPVAYRPPWRVLFPMDSNNAIGFFGVYQDGMVNCRSGSSAWIHIAGVFAPADPSPVPNPVFPVTFKHGLKGTARPLFVHVLDALDVTDSSAGVHVSTTVTWQASGDSVRIEDLPGLHANRTYKVTFLVIGE
jgi:hypothetical protein